MSRNFGRTKINPKAISRIRRTRPGSFLKPRPSSPAGFPAFRFALILTWILFGAPLFASQLGVVEGWITDPAGEPVSVAEIKVSSPSWPGGPSHVQSDTRGFFRVRALPSGEYRVLVSHPLHIAQEYRTVSVVAHAVTRLRFEMEPMGQYDEVTVTSSRRRFDPGGTSRQSHYSSDSLERMSLGSDDRSVSGWLSHSSGVVGRGNLNILGSSLGENRWLIDGLDLTDPATATLAQSFIFDAVREIHLEKAVFHAEYGRALGGVVNLVTQSGRDQLSATLDFRYGPNAWSEHRNESEGGDPSTSRQDLQLTFSGPLGPQNLWYFLAAEFLEHKNRPVGSPTLSRQTTRPLFAKLNWRLTQGWQGSFSYLGGETENHHADSRALTRPEAGRNQQQGGPAFSLHLTGVMGKSRLLRLSALRGRWFLDSLPESGDLSRPGHHVALGSGPDLGLRHTNYDRAQVSKRARDQIQAVYHQFFPARGHHDTAMGIDVERTQLDFENFAVADFRLEDRALPEGGWEPFLMWYEPRLGLKSYEGDTWGGFLEDSWSPWTRLSLYLGARYDRVQYRNDEGLKKADMDKVQPRLGAAFDLKGDGTLVLRGGWGRYLHPAALNLPLQAPSFRRPVAAYLNCQTAAGLDRDTCQTFFSGSYLLDGDVIPAWRPHPDQENDAGFYLSLVNIFSFEANQIAHDLEPTSSDSWFASLEYEIASRTTLQLAWTSKTTENLMENTCEGNVPSPQAGASCSTFTTTNLGFLKREYRGATLELRSRFLDLIELESSYTWSESKGHLEFTQGVSDDFDFYPEHFLNRYGYLSDDARHRVRLNAWVDLPKSFNLAFSFRWRSGLAYTQRTPTFPYGDRFLSPRGAFRSPTLRELNLEFRRKFEIHDSAVTAYLTAFNIFDSQSPLAICEQQLGCGDVSFGDGLEFQPSRRLELGVRFRL